MPHKPVKMDVIPSVMIANLLTDLTGDMDCLCKLVHVYYEADPTCNCG